MPAQPLRPLIRGMLAMLLVMGAVGLIYALYHTTNKIETKRPDEEARRRVLNQQGKNQGASRLYNVQAALLTLEVRANKGDPVAQHSFGRIREIGLNPSHFNAAQPAAWFLGRPGISLFAGEPPRVLLTTAIFFDIPTLPSNERLAAEWYLRAALQGDAEAQFDYARHLSFARTDPVESAKWYLLADFRYVDKQGLIIQGKRPEGTPPWVPVTVTPEQRAEAERRARAFVPRPEPKK